ncbi:hypothetical protein EYF80_032121 [Liparis tanakae]|uniref:Uncharacterized protein n=1 Tax=Liparis tanakae TaxID=230148 RepID=A0A4Z2GW28_9TELE|nr:hypothetical protein EYF80_032121 [Liparis tanakae]
MTYRTLGSYLLRCGNRMHICFCLKMHHQSMSHYFIFQLQSETSTAHLKPSCYSGVLRQDLAGDSVGHLGLRRPTNDHFR